MFTGSENFLLLIFHPNATFVDLPSPSRDIPLVDNDLDKRRIGSIDVLYWEDKIYKCKMNDNAIKEFIDILKKKSDI